MVMIFDYLDTDWHLDILTLYDDNDYLDTNGHLDMLTLFECRNVFLLYKDRGSDLIVIHIGRG